MFCEGFIKRMSEKNVVLNNSILFNFDECLLIKNDVTTKLRPKVAILLKTLLENRASVVTREALIDQVWPGRYGADESLSRSISELRSALSCLDQSAKHWIRTVPKTGYKLDVVTTIVKSPNEAAKEFLPSPLKFNDIKSIGSISSAKPIWFGFFLVTLFTTVYLTLMHGMKVESKASITPESIAVMVLDNLTNDTSFNGVAIGLTEEILHVLANNTNLKVIARTSSQFFHGKNATVQEVADALNVTHILEGSIRDQDGSLRVTIQLIETQTETQLWSKYFEYDSQNITRIQDDVAQKVTDSLNLKVKYPSNYEVNSTIAVNEYERYLKVRGSVSIANSSELAELQTELQEILLLQPEFDKAKILLSIVLSIRANRVQIPETEAFNLSQALLTGLEKKHDYDAMYWLAKGLLHAPQAKVNNSEDKNEAFKYYDKGLSVSPDYYPLIYWYQQIARFHPDKNKFSDLVNEGLKVAPLSIDMLSSKSQLEYSRKAYVAAEATARKIIYIDSSNPDGHSRLAYALQAQNKYIQMDHAAQACLELDPKFMNCWELKLDLHIRAGQFEIVDNILNLLVKYAPPASSSLSLMALINQGKLDEALNLLSAFSANDMSESYLAQNALVTLGLNNGKNIALQERLLPTALKYTSNKNRIYFSYLFYPDNAGAIKDINEYIEWLTYLPDKSDAYLFSLVEAKSLIGMEDEAISLLNSLVEKGYEKHYMWNFYRIDNSPFLGNVRAHKDYPSIAHRYKEKQKAFAQNNTLNNKTLELL